MIRNVADSRMLLRFDARGGATVAVKLRMRTSYCGYQPVWRPWSLTICTGHVLVLVDDHARLELGGWHRQLVAAPGGQLMGWAWGASCGGAGR